MKNIIVHCHREESGERRSNLLPGPKLFLGRAFLFLILGVLAVNIPAHADITTGLVGYWNLDDGSGTTATDSSGAGHNGTLENSPTWTSGVIGNGAVHFNGVNQSINLGNSGFGQGQGAFSVSLWFQADTANSTEYRGLADIAPLSGSQPWTLYISRNNDLITFNVENAAKATVTASSNAALSDISWHHVVGVYNGTNVLLYVDGILQTTQPALSGLIINNGGEFDIDGYGNDSSNQFAGVIDDVRVYDRALASSDVQDLYGLSGKPLITLPTAGSNVSGQTTLQASLFDSAAGIQFQVDGTNLGNKIISSPYQMTWDTTTASSGTHMLTAIALDLSGNALSTSAAVSVTVGTVSSGGSGGGSSSTTLPIVTNTTVGSFPAGTTAVDLTVTTTENAASVNATCKYGPTANVAYASLPNTFATTGGSSHSTTINLTGGNGASYTYYVRCMDANNNVDTFDYPISFYVNANSFSYAGQGLVIGTEGLQNLPASALWNYDVNFMPGNGDTVTTNPPRFTWAYVPDLSNNDCANGIPCMNWAPHEFILQVATSLSDLQNQQNLLVNVTTSYNFYNTLGPLYDTVNASNTTFYWRIGYLSPASSTSSTWTMQPASWSSTVNWSNPKSFTIASGATVWDRSMLSNENYLVQHAGHPHMLFNSSNRQTLASSLNANNNVNPATLQCDSNFNPINNTSTWAKSICLANKAIAPNSWLSQIPQTDVFDIANLAFVWQMTQNSNYLNGNGSTTLTQALVNAANYYVSSGEYHRDVYVNSSADISKFLALAYDWLYQVMTPTQQTTVLNALALNAKFLRFVFYPGDSFTGLFCDFSVPNNSCIYMVRPDSEFEGGTSHSMGNFFSGAPLALAAYGDDPDIRWLFDAEINYMIGKTYSLGSDGGMDQGRPYDWDVFLAGDVGVNQLYNTMLAQIVFPESKLNTNPFWQSVADWWGRMTPVGFLEQDEPWGDDGWGTVNVWNEPVFSDLASFAGSNYAYEQYTQQSTLVNLGPQRGIFSSGVGPDFTELAIPSYFPAPTAPAADNVFSKVNVTEGWSFGCSGAYNTPDCFNGVGFIFQARPRGGDLSLHDYMSDLSFQMWAYGVPITDAGDCPGNNICQVSHLSQEHYSILVNGIGQQTRTGIPLNSANARIFACEGASGCPPASGPYVYVAADATNEYPVQSYPSSGYSDQSAFSATLPFLQRIHRHLLFVKNKYFVIYDDLGASQAVTYSMLYDVPYLYNVVANGSSDVSSSQADELQYLNAAKNSFSYTTGNLIPADSNRNSTTQTKVTTVVTNINDPSSVTVNDESGAPSASGLDTSTNILSNPITGVVDPRDTNDDAATAIHPRAHTIWISNTKASPNFHFMTVVYPIKPGDSTPTITAGKNPDGSIDDSTAIVTNSDGSVDVISFDANTTATSQNGGVNIVVDLPDMTPTPLPNGAYGLLGSSTVSGHNLNVTLLGAGTGTVTGSPGTSLSSPTGIDCGSVCTAIYNTATPVTLTATVAAGSSFAGWSGACSGTGSCLITMNSDQNVTATFTSAGGSSGIYGDVNGDGNVTIYDAELTAQEAIGLNVANFNSANAEVDGTGNVDIYDAFLIAEYAIGKISKFPVQ